MKHRKLINELPTDNYKYAYRCIKEKSFPPIRSIRESVP